MSAELFLINVFFYFVVFMISLPILLFVGSFVGQFLNRFFLIKKHGREEYIREDKQYYSDGKFREFREDIWHLTSNLLLLLIGLILVMIIIGSVTFMFVKYQEPVETRHTEVELYSVYSNSMVSGRFYLFGNTIEGNQVYEYFYMTEDGGFIRDYIVAKDIIIYQNNDESPRIERITTTKTKKILFLTSTYEKNRYVIYIPEGSIQNSFNLN
jgi:Na+-transporting methylmalonyl-CoA/oxaloacetate decarboxylase gamma subunit